MVYSARFWTRGVAAKHAALSRPRSRVRIPSGPPEGILYVNRQPGLTKVSRAVWLNLQFPAHRCLPVGFPWTSLNSQVVKTGFAFERPTLLFVFSEGRHGGIPAGDGQQLQGQDQTNRAMVRTKHILVDVCGYDAVLQIWRYHEVIQAPAHIALTCPGHHVPPRIFHCIRM
jgi:hypothetical protein